MKFCDCPEVQRALWPAAGRAGFCVPAGGAAGGVNLCVPTAGREEESRVGVPVARRQL